MNPPEFITTRAHRAALLQQITRQRREMAYCPDRPRVLSRWIIENNRAGLRRSHAAQFLP